MIFGRNKYKEGWRIRRHKELQKLVKEDVKSRRAQRIKLWGHINIMIDINLVMKITDGKRIGIITE